jgi:hypothetical protein
MTVERLAYTLSLAGEAVAEGVLEPALFVPRLGEATLSWTVDASLAEHPGLWRAVVGTYAGEPLPFEVEGQMRFLSDAYAFTTGVRPLFSGTLSARETIQPPRLTVVRRAHEVIVVRPDAPAVRLALEVATRATSGTSSPGAAWRWGCCCRARRPRWPWRAWRRRRARANWPRC